MKNRSLLIKCLIASLFVHLSALFFFYRHPLILNSPLATLFKKRQNPLEKAFETIDLGAEEKNRELEEAFAKLNLPSSQSELSFDALHFPGEVRREASTEKSTADLGIFTQEITQDDQEGYLLALPVPSFVPKESLTIDDTLSPFPQIAIDTQSTFSPLTVPLEQAPALFEEEETASYSSVPVPTLEKRGDEAKIVEKSFAAPLAMQENKIDAQFDLKELPFSKRKIVSFPASSSFELPQFELENAPPDLNTYLFPEIAEAEEWEERFDAKIALMPESDGKGYVFSLTLQPNDEGQITKIPQNFYFLIDRSNTIEKHRFSVFKRAVLKALSCLQDGDKFNIILFDKRSSRLSEKNLPFSRASIQKAEEFLDKEEHGGVFASSDLLSSLTKVIPQSVSEKEVHTAILLTDGHSTQNASRQQKKIANWIEKNSGKVSLFTAAVGRGNNLVLLDLLSATSGGELLYSDTHAAFPRRLGKLVLNLREPLLKDIMISLQPKDKEASVQLYTSSPHLPTFYQHLPYEIVGTIDKPCDFTLLIQGRHKEEWIAIKKEISFKQAAKANRLLEKKWLGKQAQACYGNFLKEGKAAELSKAKDLLKSAGNEIAFE